MLKPNYHAKMIFKKVASNRNKKIKVLMYKLVCLDLKVLHICEMVMYEFWNDYMKPKYGVKTIWTGYLCDNVIIMLHGYR